MTLSYPTLELLKHKKKEEDSIKFTSESQITRWGGTLIDKRTSLKNFDRRYTVYRLSTLDLDLNEGLTPKLEKISLENTISYQDTCSALGVANYFLRCVDLESGDLISPLKLQKLIYYAQAWSLVLLDKSFFREDIEAWVHGPVVRTVWEKYKRYKYKSIPQPHIEEVPEFDPEKLEVLNEVWSAYGELSAKHLEALTHSESPWQNARNGVSPDEKSNAVISHEDMKSYYSSLLL